MEPALFRTFPALAPTIPWVGLIDAATPVHRLDAMGKRWGAADLYTKREDRTDSCYGGNKVRNLEFLLGDALHHGALDVVTLAPVGSNFVAALAAQARKLRLGVFVKSFVPAHSPQIDAHARFSEAQGAESAVYPGRLGALPAWIEATTGRAFASGSRYWIAPGGSSVTGALGHVSAMLEFAEQLASGAAPRPDRIVVGAGTCGTIAGLLAGLRIAGLDIPLVGVRCVDRIVCNRFAIARLANGVLRRLGTSLRVARRDVLLIDPPFFPGYGVPATQAAELAREFFEEEEIRLDTTYTTKVAAALREIVQANRTGRTLYWHTFSGKATRLPVAARVVGREPTLEVSWRACAHG